MQDSNNTPENLPGLAAFPDHAAEPLLHGETESFQKAAPKRRYGRIPRIRTPQECAERFWSKVKIKTPNDCWPWTAGTFQFGYGLFVFNGVNWPAHRFSWLLTHGPEKLSLFICHHCDNPPCVNPSHLFAGTQADNVADCFTKGRRGNLRGENNAASKLTREQVLAIKLLGRCENPKRHAIAAQFGVSYDTIYKIHRGVNWGWLTI